MVSDCPRDAAIICELRIVSDRNPVYKAQHDPVYDIDKCCRPHGP